MSKTNEFDDISEKDIKESKPIRTIFFSIILFIILTIIYSRYIGTSGLLIKEYNIKTNNETVNLNGFKIVHFSDFHYGRTTNINSLKKLVTEINYTKPDLIVFTGDFVDKDIKITDEEQLQIIDELKKLDSTYGNYYVNGNHDIKYDKFYEMFDNSNFVNLNDNYDIIYNKNNESILLCGTSTKKKIDYLNEVINGEYIYKINIMHYPDYYDDLEGYNFNMILAGHSHNGQIVIPGYGAVIKPNMANKYYKPYYKLNNTDFYISSGIGTSRYNYRLFNRPSFNLYRFSN